MKSMRVETANNSKIALCRIEQVNSILWSLGTFDTLKSWRLTQYT